MHLPARSSLQALFACAVLSISSALGQSVSIAPKDGTNYVVEASAPAGASYTLQASANLHLWVDIHDIGLEKYTYQFAPGDARFRYFRLIPTPPAAPDIVVLLLGDSMTADISGWGSGFKTFFKPNATIVNYAEAYTSTKVFMASPEWDKMLLIEPNYVLIQYGFMDSDPSERGSNATEFEANLRTIVETVRSFNGVPILVTLHSGRYFDAQDHVIPLQAWEGFNVITRKVAADLHTHLIDLNRSSAALLNKLGYDGSEFLRLWPNDLMHLSQPLGSKYVGQLVVSDLPDDLGPYLIGLFDPLPKP
jgi:hypothetical protein